MSIEAFIESEYAALLGHPIVVSVEVVRLTANRLDRYLRVRCALSNGHSFEGAIHVALYAHEVLIDDYRYQWLDANRCFLRRWDNAPHYPNVPGFPHHSHVGREEAIEAAAPMSLSEIIELIAALIGNSSA